jgi:2-dehydropantoate 2-reductase
MVSGQTIGIAGAGSIGCFVGGMLAAGGRRVALLARPRVIAEIEAGGLRPTSFEGFDQTIARDRFALSENPHLFEDAGIVLVTVKSADTAAMAGIIARHAPSDAVIVSLQNGVGNAAVLRHRLPGRRVLGGMVPFNVMALGNGRFHRATSGDIVIAQDWAHTAEQLSVPGLTVRPTDNIDGVQWGKLLLNLNNPINALSGLPLREQLLDRGYRRCLAALMDEALEALSWANIVPAQLAAVPARRLPFMLRLPTPLFRLVAARMLRIDDKARSSMADDLALGRRTEIDALCGEVARLARSNGARAPINEKMVALLEAWPERPEHLSAERLQSALGLT